MGLYSLLASLLLLALPLHIHVLRLQRLADLRFMSMGLGVLCQLSWGGLCGPFTDEVDILLDEPGLVLIPLHSQKRHSCHSGSDIARLRAQSFYNSYPVLTYKALC